MKVMLVTGGAGFVGSNFIKFFLSRNKNFIIANIDKLTHAGNLENLRELEDSPRYHFIKGDICNIELVDYVLRKYRPNCIVNFASESSADKSINHPASVVSTNIMGTLTLLEGARFIWGKQSFLKSRYGSSNCRFIQVSASNVYGSNTSSNDYFFEESALLPNNPYSAAKAGADLLIRAYSRTYNMPVITTRCCYNFGPFQRTDEFIPKCITNILKDKPIPIYGNGTNTREWIHALDHCIALTRVLFYGKPGEIYNIGSSEVVSNIELARMILRLMDKPTDSIQFIPELPGNDERCTVNSYKTRSNLNWSHKYKLEEGLKETIKWYKDHRNWWDTNL